MKENTTTRIQNANNMSKESLIEKIKINDPERFDQMLIENEERKIYFYVKYDYSAFSRIPYILEFPLHKDLENDFNKIFSNQGEIALLKDDSFIKKIKAKGKIPEIATNYSKQNLIFADLKLDTSDDKVLQKQPLFYIPKDIDVCDCHTCDGDKYTKCPESECGGKHIYDCRICDAQGKVDCKSCQARGEYRCPSCNGSGSLKCTSCRGSGYDKKNNSIISKCKSCNGSGQRKCSSVDTSGNIVGLGLGNLATAAVKKGFNEYCGGSGIISCATCKKTGKIICENCSGQGDITCKTCYGDHKENRYGKVDCATCETAGKIATITYIETEVKTESVDLLCTDGNKIEAKGFDVNSIKKFVNQNGPQTLSFMDLNDEQIENYQEYSAFASKNAMVELGIYKDKYPKLIKEELYVEGIPCATFSYNHFLSATFHDVSVLSIDKEQEIFYHSNPADIAEEKESFKTKIGELLKRAFSTKSYKDKIDRKHEMFLMIHMAKADGIIEEKEKRYLSATITGLQGFTKKEKAEIFSLMSSSDLPQITPKNAYFSSKERALVAKEKIVELVAKADGEYEPEEKVKLEEIKNAIELGFKAKPSFLGQFFKTWQISIPIIINLLVISVLVYWLAFVLPIKNAEKQHIDLLEESDKIEQFLSSNPDEILNNEFDLLILGDKSDIENKINELQHDATYLFNVGKSEISYKDFWNSKRKELLQKLELYTFPDFTNEPKVLEKKSNEIDLNTDVEDNMMTVVALEDRVYFYSKPNLSTKMPKIFFVKGQMASNLGYSGDFTKIDFEYNGKHTIGFVLTNEIGSAYEYEDSDFLIEDNTGEESTVNFEE